MEEKNQVKMEYLTNIYGKPIKRNQPHDAWPKEGIQKIVVSKGGSISYKNPDNSGGLLSDFPDDYVIMPVSAKRTLFDGRYCAVSGFVFCHMNGKWNVLANKRGEGAPDFKHCWNVICGFLEGDETDKEGISREVREETGYIIDPSVWKFQSVETDPRACNNGNVSLRFTTVLTHGKFNYQKERSGGEENEVEAIKWIPIDSLDEYEWAFNHKELITKMFEKLTWIEKAKARLKGLLP